jgi:hypothetical protein
MWVICMGVKRWNTMAALLLLGLWAACSVNCAFESLAGAESVACCNSDSGDSGQEPLPASRCACSVLISAACVPHTQPGLKAFPADAVLVFYENFAEATLTAPAFLLPPIASPPELVGSWQFFLRAALPARAPSLVS